ncbi:hypothetical protein Golomagni_00038 [Golovinomyces magnicellulatus]|nr:hypothetical protein Golomagni_00038 [Golovinomyces magnicellulatus]
MTISPSKDITNDASNLPPQASNLPAPPDGFERQLTDLGKKYTDNDNKFGGKLYDILSTKLLIFYEYCSNVDFKEDQYHNAYSSILKDRSQRFFKAESNKQ